MRIADQQRILRRLARAIEKAPGERKIHRLLKEYPSITNQIVQGKSTRGHVIAEFSLGDEFRSDFVVLKAFSGGWEISFIELEPPSARLFKRDDTYGARLAQALKQVEQWKRFVKRPEKESYLAQQLERAVCERDLLWPERRGSIPTDSVGWPITHKDSMLLYFYHVIIGRRAHLTSGQTSRKALFRESNGVELITYDRVLDVARWMASNPASW